MADLQDYIDHVLADSPLLYWPLQETSGNAQDATANNRDGTLTSGGLWIPASAVAARGDKCFNLPAGNTGAAYLTYTGTMDTNAGTGMSVEFWLRPDVCASTAAPILHSDTGSNKFAVTLSNTTGSIRFSTSGSTGRITVTDGAPPGQWAHWVFTQDNAGSSRVYKNGALVGGPSSQTVGADFPDLKLSNGTNTTLVTMWQHVAVFNTVLSATRVAERFAQVTDDLYSFIRPSFLPGFLTLPSGGTPPPIEGQLWPRGNP